MPTYKEIITDAKDRMSKTREAFKREMQSMRAGRGMCAIRPSSRFQALTGQV